VGADFFNILNRSQSGQSGYLIGDPNFGIATYWRQGVSSGFPASTPLNKTARQVQILRRADFKPTTAEARMIRPFAWVGVDDRLFHC